MGAGSTHSMAEIPTLRTLDELVAQMNGGGELYVRYSEGPEKDQGRESRDYESGLDLPGLSVNQLAPESWWTRPLEEWLARQLCQYAHLSQADDDRHAWILRGRVVGRGPDNEPLVADVTPVAELSADLIDQARKVYEERFDVGRDSTPGSKADES